MSLPSQTLPRFSDFSEGCCFSPRSPSRAHGGAAARCPGPTSAPQQPRPSAVTTATPPRPSRHIARRAQAPPSRRCDWPAAIAPSRHSAADWPAPLRHGRAVPRGGGGRYSLAWPRGRPARGPPSPFAPIAPRSLPQPPFLSRGAAGRQDRVKEGGSGTASSPREAAAGCPGAGR